MKTSSFLKFLKVMTLPLLASTVIFSYSNAAVQVSAAETGNIATFESKTFSGQGSGAFSASAAADGYIRQQLGIVSDVPSVGSAGVGDSLTGASAKVYQKLEAFAADVAAGKIGTTSLEIPITEVVTPLAYTAEELGVSAVVSGGKITEEAMDAYMAKIDLDVNLAMDALMSDHPYEMYWYDKMSNYSGSYPGISSDGESLFFVDDGVLSFSFSVAAEYSVSGEQGTTSFDQSFGRAVTAAVGNAKNIVADHRYESDLDKLNAYKEAICDLVSYNTGAAENADTPYGNPWQLVWVFDGDPETKVVCEGYAKAFQYLCDLSDFQTDISVYCVGGQTIYNNEPGAHMWNVVNMGDGCNYLADVTNCDEGIGAPDLLFMAGYSETYESNGVTGYGYQAHGGEIVYFPDSDSLNMYSADQLVMSDGAFSASAYPEVAADWPVQTTTFSLESVWVDTDGTTAIEPDDDTSATVYFKRNGTETGESYVLNKTNNWSGTAILELVDGAAYEASRIEVEGYKFSTKTTITGTAFDCTVTFTKESSGSSEAASLNVKAAFVDEDGVTPYTPADDVEVSFYVLRNGTQVGGPFVLKKANGWSLTVSGLTAGDGIVYEVTEDVPDGFAMDSIKTADGVTTITNRKLSDVTSYDIPVYVSWLDTDGVTVIDAPISSLPVYLVVNDKRTGDSLDIMAPEWSGIFEDIQKVSGGEYTVEINAMEGFDAAISAVSSGDVQQGFRISLIAQESEEERIVSIPVTIEWLNENGTAAAPEGDPEVEVRLLKDGMTVASAMLNAMNNWTVIFEDITLTKGSTWFVEESVPDGYTMVYRGANTDNKVEDGFTIRNQKQSTATLTIPVSATWSDPQGGSVPEAGTTLNVYVTINGERTGEPVVLKAGNNWAGQFTSVPVVAGAAYGVTIDALSEYTTEISANVSGDPAAGYVIANTKKKTGQIMNIPVTVVWKDTDGTTDLEPAASAVTVYLLRDWARTGDSLSITASDGWQKSFMGILWENGSCYSVELQSVSGFTGYVRPNGSGTLSEGFTATLIKKSGSPLDGATPSIVEEGMNITYQLGDQGEDASYQWQYSLDGGITWTNWTETGNDQREFTITIQASFHGRQMRCLITKGTQILRTKPGVFIVVRSFDPYSEDVLQLPSNLTEIEAEAFAGTDAYTVVIPDSVRSIGSRAFADCDALRYIVIPDGLVSIAEDAFEDDLVIFVCGTESDAAAYAMNHGIPVMNP